MRRRENHDHDASVVGVAMMWSPMTAYSNQVKGYQSCEDMRDSCPGGFYYWNACFIEAGTTWGLHSCGVEGPPSWCYWEMQVGCS